MKTNELVRKLDVGANATGLALAELARLADHLQAGKPLSLVLMQCEELGEAILRIESAVGVRTPQALFE